MGVSAYLSLIEGRRGWALINFFCLWDGRLFEVGANSRLGAYSNKYGKYRATLIKYEEVMCSIQFVRADTSIHVRIIMAQSIPSVPSPVPRAFVILSVLAVGFCQKTSSRGWVLGNSSRGELKSFLFRHPDSFRFSYE